MAAIAGMGAGAEGEPGGGRWGFPGTDGLAMQHAAQESGGGGGGGDRNPDAVGMCQHTPASGPTDTDASVQDASVPDAADSAAAGGDANTPAGVKPAATGITGVRRRELAGDECDAPASSRRRRSSDPVDVAEFNHFYGLTDRAKQEQTSPDLFNRRSSSTGTEIAQWDSLFGGQAEVKVSYAL